MASIEQLKAQIDLHDLAARLGLERPGGAGNYRSPHHADKSPSLSVFPDGRGWKDWSSEEHGDCIDLVCYVRGGGKAEAIRELHEMYGIPMDRPETPRERRQLSRAEFIAERCTSGDMAPAVAYLTEQRGIPEALAARAVKLKTIGWNTWESDKVAAGERGHGGPALAQIVRTLNPGEVVAVDLRYADPGTNGGVKTQTQGEKLAHPWYLDLRAVKAAETVVLVESPINALSVEAAGVRRTAALALRGTNNAALLPLEVLRGKRAVICLDADKPDEKGKRPGPEAAWTLHERLTGAGIGCLMVDQLEWYEAGWNDLNDVLLDGGAAEVKKRLAMLEPWLIPGVPGKDPEGVVPGRRRVFLPAADFRIYWRYRVREDFTYTVTVKRGDDGEEVETPEDVAGFRVAGLSRVTVASHTATMTGEVDAQPRVLFAASVQVPRHGPALLRHVFDDPDLHNVEKWKRLGPVFKPAAFSRLLTVLERAAHLGARDATNFVGLAWRNGKLVVNEGPDCYFTDPAKQCPYHNLAFPSGTVADARRVIEAYRRTFKNNAASQLLAWALGAHLKAFLGFWPHQILQADKGAGKSTLIKRLERTIAFTMFSGESLQTAFRLLTSISHTSHPVGWEELSARQQMVIDAAVTKLQESYQYTVSRRSSEMTEYLLSAPVLLAGEDVPVRSLLGKVVRVELTGRKGEQLPHEMPRFPVRQWLEFLAGLKRERVLEAYHEVNARMLDLSRASGDDDGAVRMAGNYAAVGLAWRLLSQFADLDAGGDFAADLVATMNGHIAETSADREPWVWIMETLLSEIAAGRYQHPHAFDLVQGEHREQLDALIFRSSHVMDHISREPGLRDKWNALPVKSDRVFKRQLLRSGVVVNDDVEKVIKGRREAHLVAVGVERLHRYGLHASVPQAME